MMARMEAQARYLPARMASTATLTVKTTQGARKSLWCAPLQLSKHVLVSVGTCEPVQFFSICTQMLVYDFCWV